MIRLTGPDGQVRVNGSCRLCGGFTDEFYFEAGTGKHWGYVCGACYKASPQERGARIREYAGSLKSEIGWLSEVAESDIQFERSTTRLA